ncbi:MAG: DedD protein [Cycloclasticus sp.]|jgi:DedD protein
MWSKRVWTRYNASRTFSITSFSNIMEQPLKQRLIGATIIISLAVIFVPMLIGHQPTESDVITIDIPEEPSDLDSKILALPEQENEVLAEVSISKETGVKVSKPAIPKPPEVKTVEGVTAWVVQVGSFSEQKNADNLANKLKMAGYVAFVEQTEGKIGEVYRVRVGPELSKEKADAVATQLQTEEKLPNAIVVHYP